MSLTDLLGSFLLVLAIPFFWDGSLGLLRFPDIYTRLHALTRDVVTIKPGRNPMQAARLIIQHDIGHLPMVDIGRVIGIVTRSDTMRYLYDLLPE